MKTLKNLWLVLGSFMIMIFSTHTALAQNYNVDNSASKVKIFGTSNIHDWEVDAKQMQGNIEAEINDGQLVDISELNFAVVSKSLESGKGGMDKNIYKALDADKVQRITYQMSDVKNIDCVSTNECKVSTSGFLTIAGTKKPVDLVFDAKISGNRITLTGDKTLKMTDFNVDPPTAMFGTITTGDEVKIQFQTTFSK